MYLKWRIKPTGRKDMEREPSRLIETIQKSANVRILDERNELIPFLRDQYNYEVNRQPIHRAFEFAYRMTSFNPAAMLQYYMDPLMRHPNEYYLIEEGPTTLNPIIMKRVEDKPTK